MPWKKEAGADRDMLAQQLTDHRSGGKIYAAALVKYTIEKSQRLASPDVVWDGVLPGYRSNQTDLAVLSPVGHHAE
ncbi:hypothetical protein [Agrobacterium tumefaciens]|uniref:hypothetical protein n=1 Tax=Agrobacterium tumefaciens TaxID=358 RepID=UPI0015717CE3|nr:hypothetical protein [Agrobacterium tumefaciens]NTB05411.1 hypothetical protein [Agrobacterium tumefaciens]NTE53197.1 hypothetical protein [Agrobacterium tumefaciens]